MASSQPKPTISLRPATHDDVPCMTEIYLNAFEHTLVSKRSFPSEEPSVRAYWANWIEAKINVPDTHMVVARLLPPPSPRDTAASAVAVAASPVVGWARWVRVPGPITDPPVVFSAGVYPSCGDGSVAAAFFQAAHNARRHIVGDREHWFLSMIVTRRDAQRQGVGSALMRYGVDRADADGWVSFLNASLDGKPLYDLFGFEIVDQTSFDEWGQVMYHMTRQPKASAH